MVVDDLVSTVGSWLSTGRNPGIVISSRVRLARNVRSAAFPGWADDAARVAVCKRLRNAVMQAMAASSPRFFDMGGMEAVEKEILAERHLISPELSEKGQGSALVVAGDEQLAVMINEEDHLRIQGMSPGMNLPEVWQRVNALDSELESLVDYAFSPELGYLTACPSNVGTGLRASVMMHLSGLRLTDEIDPVINGLDRLGIMVRGLQGEGTEAHGNMFQISNQATLGETEQSIIERLMRYVEDVARHEQNARARLMESRRSYVCDQVGRALGILQQACLLSSKECMDLLAGVRLGIELGIVRHATVARLNEIMLLTEPGHLQKRAGKLLSPMERDEVRASMVRKGLGRAAILSRP